MKKNNNVQSKRDQQDTDSDLIYVIGVLVKVIGILYTKTVEKYLIKISKFGKKTTYIYKFQKRTEALLV